MLTPAGLSTSAARLQTMHSGRPTTALSSRPDETGTHVVAVIEARGVSREIGLAALERETGRLSLVQVYTHTSLLFMLAVSPQILLIL